MRRVHVETLLAERPALPQKIPALVEAHADLLEPAPLFLGQPVLVAGALEQGLLFLDQLLYVIVDLLVCHSHLLVDTVSRLEEIPVLGVFVDQMSDERAERDDVQMLPASVVQRREHELRPEAAPGALLVHLGVRESDPPVAPPVGREPDEAPVEP